MTPMPAIARPNKPFVNLMRSGATAPDVTTHGDADGWDRLALNRRLKSLTVHFLTDERTSILSTLRSVERLSLPNCAARDLSGVGELSRLRELLISFTSSVDAKLRAYLVEYERLKEAFAKR
jgi:hypothetical protein